jgi:phenylpropionate dioxygenase-like ring-hydroxylating dioxygenase large terminal subunit
MVHPYGELLGEDFIAFRIPTGGRGMSNRSASPRREFVLRPQRQCGFACVYHSWKFDVRDHCIDTPTLSADAQTPHPPEAQGLTLQVREWGDNHLGLFR